MRVRRTWIGSSARMCKCDGRLLLCFDRQLTTTYSDSQNPELAAKQILAIAPILDGQKDNSQFQIPPHVPKKEEQTAPSASDPVDVKNTGSGTGSGASEAPQPSSEGKNSVERKDSRTSEVDEYVDAEEQ